MTRRRELVAFSLLGVLVGGVAALEIVGFSYETRERKRLYDIALRLSHEAGKPLLVVGAPYNSGYDCSPDVTLDINPTILKQCPIGGVLADVRDIPYSAKEFGAAFVSHVLEHLPTIEDACKAWAELWRVSDIVLVACPIPTRIYPSIVRSHHLWVESYGDYLWVDERYTPYRHALIAPDGSATLYETSTGGHYV